MKILSPGPLDEGDMFKRGWARGLEPPTTRSTIWCSTNWATPTKAEPNLVNFQKYASIFSRTKSRQFRGYKSLIGTGVGKLYSVQCLCKGPAISLPKWHERRSQVYPAGVTGLAGHHLFQGRDHRVFLKFFSDRMQFFLKQRGFLAGKSILDSCCKPAG